MMDWMPIVKHSETHDYYVDGKLATLTEVGVEDKKVKVLRFILWNGEQRDYPFIDGVCQGVVYQERTDA